MKETKILGGVVRSSNNFVFHNQFSAVVFQKEFRIWNPDYEEETFFYSSICCIDSSFDIGNGFGIKGWGSPGNQPLPIRTVCLKYTQQHWKDIKSPWAQHESAG